MAGKVSIQSSKRQSGRGTYIPLGRRKGVDVSYRWGKELDTRTHRAEGQGVCSLRAVPRNEIITLTIYEWDGRKVTWCIIKKGDVISMLAERLFLWPRPIRAGGTCVYAGAMLSRKQDVETLHLPRCCS